MIPEWVDLVPPRGFFGTALPSTPKAGESGGKGGECERGDGGRENLAALDCLEQGGVVEVLIVEEKLKGLLRDQLGVIGDLWARVEALEERVGKLEGLKVEYAPTDAAERT